jgi:alpha-beta hydrolase superfamily lysophospholipase
MKKLTILFLIPLILGCIRLDGLVFLGDNTITAYEFDKYTGEVEMDLPDSYTIPDSLINLTTFYSFLDNEYEGKELFASYIGDLSNISSDTIIVYCHGQTDHMDYYWNRTKLLGQLVLSNKIAVLTFDYRGYGLSEGVASEEGMYADVRAALKWLKKMGAKENNTILYGFSLGSAPATDAAAYFDEYTISKLILESPFASSDNLAQVSTIINTSAKYFVDMKINNADKIRDVDQDLLWMHGTKDDYIHIDNGELVYKNHGGNYKEAHRIEGAKHGNDGVPETMGFEEYLDTILAFIRK